MAAKLLLVFNLLGLGWYILAQGVERFSYEAMAAWVFSPLIWWRVLPEPINQYILRSSNARWFCDALCMLPLLLCLLAILFGIRGFRTGSLSSATAACLLMTSIFVVFHSVKQFGVTVMI
jgi:hypothetical protein